MDSFAATCRHAIDFATSHIGKPMIFDLLRVVMVSRDQTSLFGATYSSLSRKEVLFAALCDDKTIPFPYRNQQYFFVPDEEERSSLGRPMIIGRVGRRSSAENEAPERGLRDIERTQWIASQILIDPSSHEDGQKIAFEHNTPVGQPLGLARSLFNEITLQADWPYIFEVAAITEPEDFWDFERRNRGLVTEVSFELIAPNMFGSSEAIDREMAELRDREKAVSTTLTLRNSAGLEL